MFFPTLMALARTPFSTPTLVAGALLFACAVADARAADTKKFYPPDPADAPTYTLPDPLVTRDGSRITTAEQWSRVRRPEVLELFRAHVYGRVPSTVFTQSFSVSNLDKTALGGRATRKDVKIRISAGDRDLAIRLVVYTPNAAKGPSPAFLLMGNSKLDLYDPMKAPPSAYWPVAEGIERGYAMAAFWSWDVDPDEKSDTGFKDGIHALLDRGTRAPDAWATIAAWSWGMSRCLDYLVTDAAIAGDKVAVVGHSRAGKTALWAAAQDERFALACSNDSGCAGAALTRRRHPQKETVAMINKHFPHWFAESFKAYDGRHDALPVDQHMLLALIAPRPVCVASADLDHWADPRGEFLALVEAQPVYALFGLKGLEGQREMPAVDEPVHGFGTHYHIRSGKHALTRSDWNFYLDAADREFSRAAAPSNR